MEAGERGREQIGPELLALGLINQGGLARVLRGWGLSPLYLHHQILWEGSFSASVTGGFPCEVSPVYCLEVTGTYT